MQILQNSLRATGPLEQVARNVQRIANQARSVVAGDPVAAPITTGGTSIWQGYVPNGNDDFSVNVRIISGLNLMRGDAVINPLAFGDFGRAFADMATHVPQNENPGFYAIGQLVKSLQNAQAFNPTTNRIRVKRRDILDQVPGVGITQWYLPSDDVLGTMDRLLGYYETGDISGTTTDTLAVLGMMQTLGANTEIGPVGPIKVQIATMVNNGLAFVSFAGMVIQMHHSMPECMMAINLMPRDLGDGAPVINQIYSPLLSNANLGEIATTYMAWQQARYTSLGGIGPYPPNGMRMLIVIQDIFQMPNRASAMNEVACIIPFTYANMTNSPNVFGQWFYNATVELLNDANPGPAITLEKLSNRIFSLWFSGQFNTAIQLASVVPAVQHGMALPAGTPAPGADYQGIVAPFDPAAEYGKVEPVVV
ncbi:hypothetical protein CFI11_08150 [Thalassococcus sp. S3]|nr:hypothetical protein CFI11_08150 [Thalassococcus sp. S3]